MNPAHRAAGPSHDKGGCGHEIHAPLYEPMAQWANRLELQVTPVVEDGQAARALPKVYGK